MKLRLKLLFLFGIVLSTPVSVFAQQKVALLVGVTGYSDARMNAVPLKYPEADAAAIAEVLQGSGYKVVLLLGKQATREAVQQELARLEDAGDTEGALLLGFFGHGVQYGESAYFCPYDTTLRAVKDKDDNILRYENGLPRQEPDPKSMIAMREMLDVLALSPAGNKLLLADCCRDDPNRARGGLQGRAFGSALRVEELPKNCAAMFACSEGEQAFEHDDWRHGAFTKALLSSLSTGQRITANGLSESVYLGVDSLVKPKGARQRVNSLLSGGIVDLMILKDRKVVHANSYPEAVAKLKELNKVIAAAFASNDVDAAHDPLHQIGRMLDDLPALAKKQKLGDNAVAEISISVEKLFDAFGKVDEKFHGGEGATYDEVKADVDSSMDVLRQYLPK